MLAGEWFARLGLPDTADEREVRRAYARELKTIDQVSEAEKFQELREAYERAMAYLERQRRTQESEGTDQTSADQSAPVLAAVPAERSASTADAAAVSAGPVPGELAGRALLDELIGRLQQGAFGDRDEVEDFLLAALQDDRLSAVDARQFYEWGVASILASGWRAGHELLLSPAIEIFGWEEDRSRLLWLGQRSQVIDQAIGEIAIFDSQDFADRTRQRDVIRALREGKVPRTSQLLKWLPLADMVTTVFPAWMHLVSQPAVAQQWRTAAAAVPAWRRKLTRVPRLHGAPATGNKSGPRVGWIFMGLMLFSALVRLATEPVKPPTSDTERPVSGQPAERRQGIDSAPLTDYSLNGNPASIGAAAQGGTVPQYMDYANRIAQVIRRNIFYAEPSSGNPMTEVEVRTTLDGHIASYRLTRASGTPGWDAAVLRALGRTERLPPDDKGNVPAVIYLVFKPR